VGLGRGLGGRQAADSGGLVEQGVVPGVRLCVEPSAAPGGRDDEFEGTAEVGDRTGKDLAGRIGRCRFPGSSARVTGVACRQGLPVISAGLIVLPVTALPGLTTRPVSPAEPAPTSPAPTPPAPGRTGPERVRHRRPSGNITSLELQH
jgi:hypothetical protein